MSEFKENNKLSCAVARDLMPLYVENLTEEETTEMMREHIASCAACAQSYGMQKTRLEIEKKPQRPDFSGVKFFKKSFLKRIALIMAVAIMGFLILAAGFVFLFENHDIDKEDIRIVGQYELSDGSIVIALQAEGYCVNELHYYYDTYPNHSYYGYSSDGTPFVRNQDVPEMAADIRLFTDRITKWTRASDSRGEIFYYTFNPDEQATELTNRLVPFSTPTPMPDKNAAEDKTDETKAKPVLQALYVNDWRVWKMGDPLRTLSAEEEEVLLRAMKEAGFLDKGTLLPQTDIIDTLMSK